ncbi:MAG TPA: hypothetical protein VGL63_02930 [Streptosporangiaceae bacterium]|jgi:hypothetical protein
MAVGTYRTSTRNMTLAEQWNGSTWSVLPSLNPRGAVTVVLTGVSCASVTRCTAVGDYTPARSSSLVPLAEHWNGSNWSVQAIPVPAGTSRTALQAVSCRLAASCTAVGWSDISPVGEQPLAEHWDGTSWTIQATPATPGTAALTAVSCASADSCTAAGGAPAPAAPGAALAEHWDGSTWAAQAIAVPAGAAYLTLTGISCPTASACTLAGYFSRPTGGARALAERRNGTAWKVQQTAAPSTHKLPAAISCTASRACTMTGFTSSLDSGAEAPLAEQEP